MTSISNNASIPTSPSVEAATQKLAAIADASKASEADVAPATSDDLGKLVQALVDKATEAWRERSGDMRAKCNDLADGAISYAKVEPVKAVLAAAAGGAMLMAVLGMLLRTRD